MLVGKLINSNDKNGSQSGIAFYHGLPQCPYRQNQKGMGSKSCLRYNNVCHVVDVMDISIPDVRLLFALEPWVLMLQIASLLAVNQWPFI